MVTNKDKIPTWVGRPVVTDELTIVEPTIVEAAADPTSAGRTTPTEPLDTDNPANAYKAGSKNEEPATAPGSMSAEEKVSSHRTVLAALIGVVVASVILAAVGSIVLSGSGEDGPEIATNATEESESAAISPGAAAVDDESGQSSSSRSNNPDSAGDDSDRDQSDAEDQADSTNVDETPDLAGLIPSVSGQALEAHRQTARADGQSAWAVFTDGRIYLQGTLPDEAIAKELSSRLNVLLGSANVIEQYTIDDSASAPTDPPLFIKETVVFEPNGAAMPPGSDWILVVADVLMNRYPTTDITVVANGTDDAQGINRDLQVERSDAIIEYLSDRGVDGSRLDHVFIPDGEFGDDSGNKPIEFVVRGLLSEALD